MPWKERFESRRNPKAINGLKDMLNASEQILNEFLFNFTLYVSPVENKGIKNSVYVCGWSLYSKRGVQRIYRRGA